MQPRLSEAKTLANLRRTVAIRERWTPRAGRSGNSQPHVAGGSIVRTTGAEAKSAFHSLIEGLWCQRWTRIPHVALVDNDRRCTNEVSELQ